MRLLHRAAVAIAAAIAFLSTPVHATVSASLGGSTLNVTMTDPVNDSAIVTTSGTDINVIELTGGTTVFSTPIASVTAISGSGGGLLVLDGDLTLPNGVQVLSTNFVAQVGNYSVGSYFVRANIAAAVATGFPGAVSTTPKITATGGITYFVNTSQVLTGQTGSTGFFMEGGTLVCNCSSGINIQAYGDSGSASPGVSIQGNSVIQTTGTGGVSLIGTSFGTTGASYGVFVEGGSVITTADGVIGLNGTGSANGLNQSYGIFVPGQLTVTGNGTILLTGTGGGAAGSDFNDGINIPVGSGGVIAPAPGHTLALTGHHGTGASSLDVNTTGSIAGDTIQFLADSVNLGGFAQAGSAVSFIPNTPSTVANFGGADGPGTLGLTNAELQSIHMLSTFGVVAFGGANGGVTFSAPIIGSTGTWNRLSVSTRGPISGPGSVMVAELDVTDVSTTPHGWTVSGTGTFQQDGNAPITYINGAAGQGALTITGGSGSDSFNVTGSIPNVRLTIDGANPAGAVPGDRLDLTNVGALPPMGFNILAGGYHGSQNYSGNATVAWVDIESGNVVPSQMIVTAPATSIAGVPLTVSIAAQDPLGNATTNYNGPIHFSATGGSSLPIDTFVTNGAGTFNVTLFTPGTQTVTVNDFLVPAFTGTSGSIVVAGPATQFTVAAPGIAAAGSPFSYTVTALDALGQVAVGYTGTVHFTSSDGAATVPADATLVNGIGTFNATLQTAGTQTLTATDTVTSSITGTSGTVAVSAGAATHLTVVAPPVATSGTSFSVTVTALDAFNNVASGYAGTVHFTSGDAQAVLPANSTLIAGTGSFSVTLKTAGSQSLIASDTVTSSITGTSAPITVSAGAATHFSVVAPAAAVPLVAFTFTVTALDASNNAATAYSGTVHFTSSDGAAVLPADSTLAGGTGTFSATLNTVGSQTLTATDTVAAATTATSPSILVAAQTYSAPSATGTGTITASFIGGGAGCTFSAPQFIGAPPGAPPLPPTLPNPKTAFPQGMFDFSLTGCTPGSTITMTIVYPQSIAGARYWKYGPEASNPAAHWYVMPATITGNTVTFSITDGGQGDDNLAANGIIDDQGGPGLTTDSIPTLSEWMLALLALLLAGTACAAAAVTGRRR